MRTSLKRALAGSVALMAAAAGSVLVPATASAAPAPGSTGPVVLLPESGSGFDTFFMTPNPVPANCPGDTASGGFVVQSVIVPEGTDMTTLTFGLTPNAPAVELLTSTGSPHVNVATAANTGQIVNQPAYTMGFYPPNFFADGNYYIGYVCSDSSGNATNSFWTETITITNPGGVLNWEKFVAPAPSAPANVAAASVNGDIVVTFDASAGADSYEATAVPQGGGATLTATSSSTTITIPGGVVGTTYDVTVTATNASGTSAPSAPAVPVLVTAEVSVTNFRSSSAGAGERQLDWDAATSPDVTGFEITVVGTDPATPAVAGSPFTVGLVDELLVTGLDAGAEYEATIIPTTATAGVTPLPSTITFTVASAQVLQQVIQVERPEGALILTQRCGVNNGLVGEGSVAGFPGFPAVPSIPGTADQVGTSPDVDLVAPGVQDDPEFANYPFPSPATYPTRCIVDLGTAELITTGDLAGQYFAASGALDEVTVVDLRDVDAGWTINAAIPSLTEEDGDSFSGDLVGWTPQVTSTTDPVGTSTYDQIVTAGPSIVPGTAGGLSDGEVWASANAGEGLGVAVLDAYVKVLIPVSNDAGTYEGTLEITVS